MYVCICVYIYIYTHTHKYIHTYKQSIGAVAWRDNNVYVAKGPLLTIFDSRTDKLVSKTPFYTFDQHPDDITQVCMHVCVYVYVYKCMRGRTYVRTYIHTHMRIYVLPAPR